MDNPDPKPSQGPRRGPPRANWITIGYVLTAGWMVFVLAKTKGDMGHPFFDTLFIVPLAGWIVAAVVARMFGSGGPPET